MGYSTPVISQNVVLYSEFWLPPFHLRKGRKHELFISGCEKLYLPLRAYLHCALSSSRSVFKLCKQSNHHPNTPDLKAVIFAIVYNMGQKVDENSKFTLLPVKVSVRHLSDPYSGAFPEVL